MNLSDEAQAYEDFVNGLKTNYPEMYGDVYCGISIGAGWYNIIQLLSKAIHSHVRHVNGRREWLLKRDNPDGEEIPDEMEYPQVAQIKEKFGGLRFYYDGGDDYIAGLVTMAEYVADSTCEKCGAPGKRRDGGWVRTLCDVHEAEHQAKIAQRS